MGILQGFLDSVVGLINDSGFMELTWKNYVMIGISCILLYLAIKKQYEPLLLLPIAFGMLLVNLYPPIMAAPSSQMIPIAEFFANHEDISLQSIGYAVSELNGEFFVNVSADSAVSFNEFLNNLITEFNAANPNGHFAFENVGYPVTEMNGEFFVNYPTNGGLFYYLYQGVKLGIYPPLIFLGIGCMTDFGPLIANPKSFILGAAAQIGIFFTFIIATLIGFTGAEAGSIGIIGGADGPTAIYVTSILSPDLLGPIAVAAYSYMALVPIIQPPFMKLLTTKKERSVVMKQLRPVSKLEKILFPIIVTVVVALLLPSAAPLVGMLMLGNLFKESGVVDRIFKTAQNELMNIITIFLGVTVGATATGEVFLRLDTLKIIGLGLAAFCLGTIFGILFGKLLYVFTKGKVNPLIGSAGVSAVPMAARVSNKVGQQENPANFLLMHAMGPNVAGVIGSAVAAGVLISILG